MAPPATITAEVQFVGPITALSSNTGCATVSPRSLPATKPPGSSVYRATFTVSPVAAGSCRVTLTDKKGGIATVQVVVAESQVALQRSTLVAAADHSCALTEEGEAYCCGLRTDGAAYCWGANQHGQLGDGSTTPHPMPAAVRGDRRSRSSPPVPAMPAV